LSKRDAMAAITANTTKAPMVIIRNSISTLHSLIAKRLPSKDYSLTTIHSSLFQTPPLPVRSRTSDTTC
jgi:hypothetical protein